MATASFQMIRAVNTIGHAQSNITNLIAALSSLGLQQSSITGQTDAANATYNTGPMGHQYLINSLGDGGVGASTVWGFDDDLQAEAPVWIRIYQLGNPGGFYGPVMKIDVGTDVKNINPSSGSTEIASQGVSGVRTGSMLLTRYSVNASGDIGVLRNCYASGANNRLAMAIFPNEVGGYMFVVERTKDENGDDTADGIIIYGTNRQADNMLDTYWHCKFIDNTNKVYRTSIGKSPSLALAGSTGAIGSDKYVFPIFPESHKHENPMRDALVYNTGNGFTAFTPETINHYGSDKVYLPLGTQFRWASPMAQNTSVLMRWE